MVLSITNMKCISKNEHAFQHCESSRRPQRKYTNTPNPKLTQTAFIPMWNCNIHETENFSKI